MEILINKKKLGKMYCNIQFDKALLDSPAQEFMQKIKNKEQKIDINNTTFTISGYRKVYADEKSIYIEGAELA